MAFPTKTKTWEFVTNQLVSGADGPERNKNGHVMLKDLLTHNSLTSPWEITASSNTVTAGHDNTDRWLSASDIVAASATFNPKGSWMCFRQTGIGPEFHMMLFCDNSNTTLYELGLNVSKNQPYGVAGGGTDGTTTATPTSSVFETVAFNQSWIDSGSADRYFHIAQASDGSITRIFITGSGSIQGFLEIHSPAAYTDGWAVPRFIMGMQGGVAVFDAPGTTINPYAGTGYDGDFGNGLAALKAVHCAIAGSPAWATLTGNNAITGQHDWFPLWLGSSAVGDEGVHLRLTDTWLQSASGVTDGDTYDSNNWVAFGNYVFPWDGVAPPTMT